MRTPIYAAVLLLLALSMTGCDFVGDVLEFGFWLIVIGIVVVVLIAFAAYKAFLD